MEHLTHIKNLPLLVGLGLLWLAYRTPPGRRYTTLEGDRPSVRAVLFLLALSAISSWLMLWWLL